MSIQTNKLPDNPQIEVIKSGKTGLFTNYIYKAIPLAFDESMSYYETLCGLLNYLKDVKFAKIENFTNGYLLESGTFKVSKAELYNDNGSDILILNFKNGDFIKFLFDDYYVDKNKLVFRQDDNGNIITVV